MTEKNCFIIMPITTPVEYVSFYKDDDNHFIHVMEHLFTPAVEKAGFKPILPVSQGSEIIHAEIISKIESSDLVLCDMSILNPNVFFELGIRTALNKPICLVKDDITKKIPFDTNIINNQTYSSDLSPWLIHDEIEKLEAHIKVSFNQSSESNSLWRYFSLSSTAFPAEINEDTGKLEYLTMQIEATRNQIDEIYERLSFPQKELKDRNDLTNLLLKLVKHEALKYDILALKAYSSPEGQIIVFDKEITDELKSDLEQLGREILFNEMEVHPKKKKIRYNL